jgi:hypothetical protein
MERLGPHQKEEGKKVSTQRISYGFIINGELYYKNQFLQIRVASLMPSNFYTFALLNRPLWDDLPVQRQRLPRAFKMRKGVKV